MTTENQDNPLDERAALRLAVGQLGAFAEGARPAITLAEANIEVLTEQVLTLTNMLETLTNYTVRHFEKTEEIVTAQSVAIRAVWDVTKPRPSHWQRIVQWPGWGTTRRLR